MNMLRDDSATESLRREMLGKFTDVNGRVDALRSETTARIDNLHLENLRSAIARKDGQFFWLMALLLVLNLLIIAKLLIEIGVW